jgi:hypothetical protein
MSDPNENRPQVEGTPETTGVPRRSRRRPIHGVLVAIDAPSSSSGPYVVDALDVNADGIGLVMPPDLPPGTFVRLSFRLDERTSFSQVPAIVLHHDGQSAGVRFLPWAEGERLALLEYLVRHYEGEPQPK